LNPEQIDSLLPANAAPTLEFLTSFVVLAFIPLIVLTTTPFLRIVIVMYLLRGAIGVTGSPPNLVLTALSMILTGFVMGGTLSQINEEALLPLARKEISLGQAMTKGYEPLKERMLEQVEEKDIILMYNLSKSSPPSQAEEIDLLHLVPAHVLGELRVAFTLGFLVYIPFLVIDLIVANTLLALGMMMLSPTIISLPFKLLIFVAVDGWALVIRGLAESFN